MLALLALPACGPATPPRPDVLLISVDTLRADHLSVHGHARDTSPYLARLAREGIVFEQAQSTSSWTVPSVVSLVTGLHPETHGVVNGQGTEFGPVLQEVVPEEAVLLAERLAAAGYRTFAVTTNDHLHEDFGFAQGFDHYQNLGAADAAAVQQALSAWADELQGPEPRFIWLHLFDPHCPYHAREPWVAEYFPSYRRLGRQVPRVDWPGQYLQMGIQPGTPRHLYVEALYDSEIRYLDQAVQAFVEQLGIDDQDLLVLTADHGEEFLEHGKFGHSDGLYQVLLHVPLLLCLPGRERAGQRIPTPVSLLDIYPTIETLLDLGASASLPGRSLVSLTPNDLSPEPLLSSVVRHQETHSLRLEGWKLIHYPEAPASDLLFHLLRDPGEQENLAGSEPEHLVRMRDLLGEELRRARAGRLQPVRKPLNEAQIEALKALGYIK